MKSPAGASGAEGLLRLLRMTRTSRRWIPEIRGSRILTTPGSATAAAWRLGPLRESCTRRPCRVREPAASSPPSSRSPPPRRLADPRPCCRTEEPVAAFDQARDVECEQMPLLRGQTRRRKPRDRDVVVVGQDHAEVKVGLPSSRSSCPHFRAPAPGRGSPRCGGTGRPGGGAVSSFQSPTASRATPSGSRKRRAARRTSAAVTPSRRRR